MNLEDKIKKWTDKNLGKNLSLTLTGQSDINEIANDVCKIMQSCVLNAANMAGDPGVPSSVYEELSGLQVTSSKVLGVSSDGLVTIEVGLSFPQGIRPSLDSSEEGVNDIIALINNGFQVKATCKNGSLARVRGEWKGNTILSATSRPSTEFLENAIGLFSSVASSSYRNPAAVLSGKYK